MNNLECFNCYTSINEQNLYEKFKVELREQGLKFENENENEKEEE